MTREAIPPFFVKYSGCLLGGAVGDALKQQIEFHALDQEVDRIAFGTNKSQQKESNSIALISSATQMALFTAEGLLREYHLSSKKEKAPDYVKSVYHSYLGWLFTQGGISLDRDFSKCLDSALLKIPQLHHQRKPNNTCLKVLLAGTMGTIQQPSTRSKGCGGVMRAAPVGLFCAANSFLGNKEIRTAVSFELGCAIAAITHGHPLGYLPAGFLSATLCGLTVGDKLEEALSQAMLLLIERPEYEKSTLAAMIAKANRLAYRGVTSPQKVESFGEGWLADEALALSLYCALTAKEDFAQGVLMARDHPGNSHITGSITGNILGVMVGSGNIPLNWLSKLELRGEINAIAQELGVFATANQ